MEHFTAILGIISVCLVGVWSQTVSVDQPRYEVKPGANIELTCVGSSNKLEFYIENSVVWEFVHMNGNVYPLTEGFYKTTEGSGYASALYNSGHFDQKYTSGDQYTFVFIINGVTHQDNGIYRCSLADTAGMIKDSKNVSVTVLNPVQKVTLEVHEPNTHAVLAKKTMVAGKDEAAVKLKPGNYMVKCVATGSNPAPTLQVLYNDQPAGYSPLTTEKSVTNNQVKYTTTYSVASFPMEASGMEQYLTCSANIPGDYYPQKEAGIKMMVTVDRPDMMCAPLARMVGDRYGKIVCNITAPGGGLQCDMVKWYIGNTNEMINANEKYGNENHKYDIMEASCDAMGDKLEVKLNIYIMKPIHFETIFYLSYGMGDDAHRVPFEITQKPGSSNLITPFSMFIYLIITLVTRHAMQRF